VRRGWKIVDDNKDKDNIEQTYKKAHLIAELA
jgi:hypothetical protein